MVLSGDNILTLLDASYSTTKFGIVDCYGMNSFESWKHRYPFDCPSEEGDTSLSPARISYTPQSIDSVDSIIDDLDLLLTSGRLQGSANRALIKGLVEPMMGDVAKATRAAQQLIVSTPEYHTNNLPRKVDTPRLITGYTTKPKASYKAVVILMLRGGCDSWNMLVPKGQCTSGDSYEEYVAARGSIHAIPKDNLLNITTTDQVCAEFGVNNNLPILAELYNQNQAVFFANTGVVAKPMTKHDDWKKESGFSPFVHNTMQKMFAIGDTFEEKVGTGVMGRMLGKFQIALTHVPFTIKLLHHQLHPRYSYNICYLTGNFINADTLNNQGLQTSANNVASGMTMLSGDPTFSK